MHGKSNKNNNPFAFLLSIYLLTSAGLWWPETNTVLGKKNKILALGHTIIIIYNWELYDFTCVDATAFGEESEQPCGWEGVGEFNVVCSQTGGGGLFVFNRFEGITAAGRRKRIISVFPVIDVFAKHDQIPFSDGHTAFVFHFTLFVFRYYFYFYSPLTTINRNPCKE